MSFSADVKNELCRTYNEGRHCAIAECAAILNTCGLMQAGLLRLQTENAAVAKKFYMLLRKVFDLKAEVSIRKNKQFHKSRSYVVSLAEGGERVMKACGLWPAKRIAPLVVKDVCCRRAYLRGAFIAGGSLCDPEKHYHLEFVNHNEELCTELIRLMHSFDVHAKVIKRKNLYVVYLKEGEQIVELLNIMGAHHSLMDLENVRILKDMRNSVNRMVNCETANLSKTVLAAIKQVEDIRYIAQTKGLGYLSEPLEDVARVRLQYEQATLKEIGLLLSPPVGKSGVNHRLRKISEIAENLRRDTI